MSQDDERSGLLGGISVTDRSQALWGGGIAAAIGGLGIWATGAVGGGEARILLESIIPTIRFLTSSVITASATIMALMLTILSLSQTVDTRFRELHFARIRQTGTMCALAIAGGTVLLLFLSIPVGESETLRGWYEGIYYLILVASCLLGGLQVAIVLVLRRAIYGMVEAVAPEGDSELTSSEAARAEGAGTD